MNKRNEIIGEYEKRINSFLHDLVIIDAKYGTYAELEIKNTEATAWGDLLPTYLRDIKIRALDLT